MKRTACEYSIVRFAPFVETDEFANVGIVMIAPTARYFGFKLLIRRHGRITRFFKELDPGVFRAAMYGLQGELERVHGVLKRHGFDRRMKNNDVEFAKRLFNEIIRTRETIIRFSEPGVVLADDFKARLDDLFAHYVERNFVTKHYPETVMEKDIRRLLYKARIGDQFIREKVGDEEFHVTFPFVQLREETPGKIIKPLHLNQDDTTKILEHGGKWEFRLRELRKRNKLPEQVLFAVDGPHAKGRRASACHEVMEMLNNTGVHIQPYKNREQILEFARAG